MTAMVSPGWSKPSNLLFAAEIPADPKVLHFAIEQAKEFNAKLTIFHAYDTLVVAASETSGIRYYDYQASAEVEYAALNPLAEEARKEGVDCQVVVRPGLPAEQILHYIREQNIDRVIMGTRGRGTLGQLLLGSVAEAVVRTSYVPVLVIGPNVFASRLDHYKTRTVLCAVHEEGRSDTVTALAAHIAFQHKARLVLQRVIRPQDRHHATAARTLEQLERDLLLLIPINLQNQLQVDAIVVPGDPADELLYQSKAQQADLIVIGAHHASLLASLSRLGVVHKTLAHTLCPVLTVSNLVTELAGESRKNTHAEEAFMAGVF